MTNSNRAKVSVCIPVYGVEKYIERCVRSLFEQTLDSMEYVFVDDCSPDNSIEIMQKVLEEYPHRQEQVKIIRHEVNQGVGAARNHAVAACTGNYIIHCDPDDWIDLNMYETMYNKAIETDADMVYCPFVKEKSTGGKRFFYPLVTASVEKYVKRNFGSHLNSLWTKLYKREIALDSSINCPDHIIVGEDLLRNVQMLLKCKNISFCSDVIYHYWVNSESIMHNVSPRYFQCLQDIKIILTGVKSNNFQREIERLECAILIGILENYYIGSKEDRCLYLEHWKNIKNKWLIFCHCITFYRRSIFIFCGLINFHMTVYLLHLLNVNKH